jgi:hypothetical protein
MADLKSVVGPSIDLLVVTHEHADHISGFDTASTLWRDIEVKKVWFAWTEDPKSKEGKQYRKESAKIKLALQAASQRLTGADTGIAGFKNAFDELNAMNATTLLNGVSAQTGGNLLSLDENGLPTMEELLRKQGVIRDSTVVDYLDPGDLKRDEVGAEGIRFFVLGPPKDEAHLRLEKKDGENYEKREKPSTLNTALVDALAPGRANSLPFEPEHDWNPEFDCVAQTVLTGVGNTPLYDEHVQAAYDNADHAWRRIDHDWLNAAGNLALKYEHSVNNTSLVLAIQFADSERVLLFPGDAELGNWTSWHDSKLQWEVEKGDQKITVDPTYLLNKTVFYKVGHHLSQNGTATSKGLDLMTSTDFTAMATLDLKKVLPGWRNTMPNDLLSAELIRKSKGKLYFTGDHETILRNIETGRVSLNPTHVAKLQELNLKFEGKPFVEVVVSG